MVELNTGTREKVALWHSCAHSEDHLLGGAKGGSSMEPLLGSVPHCPFSMLDAASFDATEGQKHFTTPPLLSEKSPSSLAARSNFYRKYKLGLS